jgi:hypothetical protein
MSSPGTPVFSIIIPRAPGRDVMTLASLQAMDYPKDLYEVLLEAGPSPPANRNRCFERSRGNVLAFTDDDCVVDPQWLARAAAFFRDHPDYDVLGGPQLTGPWEAGFARASGYALGSFFGAYRMSRRYRRARPDLHADQLELSTPNLFLTRRAFERWGPFDERLCPNEETALLKRIADGGGRIAYHPDIVVYHQRRPLKGFARQCFGYGAGRARQMHVEGTWIPGAGVAVPGAFLLYLLLLPLLLPAGGPWWLVPVGTYVGANLVVSVSIALAHGDPAAAVWLPVAFAVMHMAYPLGVAMGAVRVMRSGAGLDGRSYR